MKVLTNLKADSGEADYREPRGFLQQIHNEPAPGFFRGAALGSAGLVFRKGEAKVAIPIEELWKLVEAAEPGLKAPAPATAEKKGQP